MSKKLIVNDILLIVFIFLIVMAVAFFVYKPSVSDTVTVMYNNIVYGVYSLDKDIVFEIAESGVTIRINDGKASIVDSDCPDKVCEHSRPITKHSISTASIVCLPNKISIVKSSESANKEADIIAG